MQIGGLFRGIGAAVVAALIFTESIQLWHALVFADSVGHYRVGENPRADGAEPGHSGQQAAG